MILKYIHADNTVESLVMDLHTSINQEWLQINTKNKRDFIQEFLPAFSSGQKIILYDANHKQLTDFNAKNNINDFESIEKVNALCQLLFFTSGSTGFPLGAFKTKENIQEEIQVLKDLVTKKRTFQKVIVTVPFVHIYGVLAGLLLPLALGDVALVVKEDFLPYELLEIAKDENTLIITTPVFIKALGKLSEEQNLESSLFISSTGPLHTDDVNLFEKKYTTSLMQIFGSTETGGIAYKLGDSEQWHPLDSVTISSKNERLSIESPFISPFTLNEVITPVTTPFITEDIVAIDENRFTLIGRSNKIIKIAGKRISASHIESILETLEGVNGAIVELIYKKELLRSEQILITLEATNKIQNKLIKEKISEYFGVLTIPFKVVYTDKINYSSMGKKITNF